MVPGDLRFSADVARHWRQLVHRGQAEGDVERCVHIDFSAPAPAWNENTAAYMASPRSRWRFCCAAQQREKGQVVQRGTPEPGGPTCKGTGQKENTTPLFEHQKFPRRESKKCRSGKNVLGMWLATTRDVGSEQPKQCRQKQRPHC